MKVVVCGPPHSGKSVLLYQLKIAIRLKAPEIYPYVLTTNPDGEGAWFQETYQRDAGEARDLKSAAKHQWTPAHAALYADWVRNATARLVLIDIGGIIDGYTHQICHAATHSIILAREESEFAEWRELSTECGLRSLAELESIYDPSQDLIYENGPLFRAAIHHLERGDVDSVRPGIEALASFLICELANFDG